MTYGPTRSANASLQEGLTDGKYKKVIANRGGFPETTTVVERRDLFDTWYGIHETQPKVAPDAVRLNTPTSPAQ